MYIYEVTQTYNRLGINSSDILQVVYNFLIFFGNPGCSGQLTRTTTNPRIH
jgi:hypothetical protein